MVPTSPYLSFSLSFRIHYCSCSHPHSVSFVDTTPHYPPTHCIHSPRLLSSTNRPRPPPPPLVPPPPHQRSSSSTLPTKHQKKQTTSTTPRKSSIVIIMRADMATVAIAVALGLVCSAQAAPPTYSCFDPPGEGQSNPLGEGLEDVVEEECCEALIDET